MDNNSNLINLFQELADSNPSHLLIVGDFNYGAIDWNSGNSPGPDTAQDQIFADTIRDNFWYQLVNKPTRKRGNDTPHILDLVIVNELNMVNEIIHDSPLGNSDHCILKFEFNCYIDNLQSARKHYAYNKAKYDEINKYLNKNWEEILAEKTVEQQWDILIGHIEEAQKLFIPTIASNKERKWKIPLDTYFIKQIKKKHRCWNRYIETRDPAKLVEYKRQRNKVRNITRKGKLELEKSIASNIKENPKLFWKYVNSKTKTKSTIPDLEETTENGTILYKDEQGKAEHLNTFFRSVQTIEPTENLPHLTPIPNINSPERIIITPDQVLKKLKKLKISKAPGPDNIHPRILKEASSTLKQPLSIIFQNSIATGEIPTTWKLANICALHKKGSKKEATNYRPVSLTCIVSKMLESILRDHIMNHLTANNLLSDKQYGFIHGRSTVSQLLKILDKWTEELDKGNYIETIYMDIKKAFDTVPHLRLLHKMEIYGLGPQLLKWTKSFISGRSQRVIINGHASSELPVISGIPQGTVLGPILFVLYMNDLPQDLLCETYMFADDTKLFKIYNDDDQGTRDIQHDLDTLYNWSTKWCLKFHPNKCTQMIITKPRTTRDIPHRHMLNDSGEQIAFERVTEQKDLGILFDHHLTFKNHIAEITKNASRTMGIIRRSFTYLTPEIFKPLYMSLVRSKLEYGHSVWNPHHITEIRKLEQVQRNATRYINGFKNLNYADRLRKLNLPTLHFRRKRGDMIDVYKIVNEIQDPVNTIKLPRAEDNRRGHQHKLFKRRATTDIRKYSFPLRIVTTWNSLPDSVVMAKSVNQFKGALDRHWRNDPCKFELDG